MVTELHISWAVTQAGQLLASGTAISEDVVARLGNRLVQAQGILESWILQQGGRPIYAVTVQGAFVVPADRVYDLGRIIEQLRTYVETDYFFGVGVGMEEAQEALRQAWQSGEPYAFYDEASGHDNNPDSNDMRQLDEELHDNPLEKAVNDGKDHWMPKESSENPSQEEGGPQNPSGVSQPEVEDTEGVAEQSSASAPEDSDDEESEDDDNDETKKMVVEALLGIKSQAAALHQLKAIKPEAFDAVKNIIQALVAMAHQLGDEPKATPTQKGESVFKKLKLPKTTVGPKGMPPPKYPDALASPASAAGTIKDGKIKVAPVDTVDGSARPQGWNQARAGMIVGPKGSAVSSREPNTE